MTERWQEINEGRHFRHSWQEVEQRIVTAMMLLLLVIAFLSAGVAGVYGLGADTRDTTFSLWH